MLHTKFRENRPAGSGEDFWWVFTMYGRTITSSPKDKDRSPDSKSLKYFQ